MITDKLISLVHLRRTLWDQGDSRHHNRYVLDKLWGEVAQELSCTSKYNSFSQLKHVYELHQESKNMTREMENLGKIPQIRIL
jgi:hypothetical protein